MRESGILMHISSLPGPYGIYEISPLPEWIGKSIKESNIAVRYKVSILGVRKNENEEMHIMPSADYVIQAKEHLMVMAHNDVAARLLDAHKKRRK